MKFLKKYFPYVLMVLGLVFIGSGGLLYNKYVSPVKNADSTMKMNSKQQSTFSKHYNNDELLKAATSGWTGRNNNLKVILNDNKPRKSEIKIANTMTNFNNYGVAITDGGQPDVAQTLYLKSDKQKGTFNSANKIRDTKQIAVTKVHAENSGVLDILNGQYLIDEHYLNPHQYDNPGNVTVMTNATRSIYQGYEDQLLKHLDDKNISGIFYRVIPVYRSQNDLVPIGYNMIAYSFKENPKLKLDKTSKTNTRVQNGKPAQFAFNVYIKNAQSGFKINYQTGKVAYDGD